MGQNWVILGLMQIFIPQQMCDLNQTGFIWFDYKFFTSINHLKSFSGIFCTGFLAKNGKKCLRIHYRLIFANAIHCFTLRLWEDCFNNTKNKNCKIQVQNKTQTLRKSYTFLSKACTLSEHININNNTTTNNHNDNNKKQMMLFLIIIIVIIKQMMMFLMDVL